MTDQFVFEAPGPGTWERDISHTTPSPTLLFRRLSSTVMPDAYREVFATFGGPLDTLDVTFVHGAMYRRIVPLIGAESDRPPPPKPLMWLALRLHPTFRKREKAARRQWTERTDRDTVNAWYGGERERWIEANRELQAIELTGLDDAQLAEHVRHLDAHVFAGWRRHHVLHGADTGPIGDLLVHARDWGITTAEVLSLLHGSSPASRSAAGYARRIGAALRSAGADPTTVESLEQVRAVPAAAVLLDEYLADAAWHVVSSYDLEAATVGELPSATCALIRAQADVDDAELARRAESVAVTEAELRARVPADQQALFDELLGHARTAYGMRDDNGPLTAEWPMGLLRRSYLEAGPRLHAQGRLDDPAHVFELDTFEVAGLLDGAPTPTAADAAERVAVRAAEAQLDPPPVLGTVHPDPDLSVFPAGIRRTMDIVVTALSLLEVDPTAEREHLKGTGIGDRAHRGTARVATSPEHLDELFAEMGPGDVLVAPWTAPTFNALFAIAGGVVVREGGPLCHAAVMARELGIPTVIGCHGAMDAIRSGDLVEVDPLAGEVRVLTS